MKLFACCFVVVTLSVLVACGAWSPPAVSEISESPIAAKEANPPLLVATESVSPSNALLQKTDGLPEQSEYENTPEDSVFHFSEIDIDNVPRIPVLVSELKKVEPSGWAMKKMSVIDDCLLIADDISGNGIVYTFTEDASRLIDKRDFGHPCTIDFVEDKVYVISESTVEILDWKLNMLNSIPIAEDSFFKEDAISTQSHLKSTMLDESHIAWFRNDRTVCVMDITTGVETSMDAMSGADNLNGLFHAIYRTNRPGWLLAAGSLYGEGDDPSIVDDSKRVYMLFDIHTGYAVTTLYAHELESTESILAPELMGVVSTNKELVSAVKENGEVSVYGITSNFGVESISTSEQNFEIYDLVGAEAYSFEERSNQDFIIRSSHSSSDAIYVLLLDTADESSYIFTAHR